MEALERMINGAQAAQTMLGQWVKEELSPLSGFVVDMVRAQLMDGKAADGRDLSPSYLKDPYFETRKQAVAYMLYKQRITPNPRRNRTAPNLYITGEFHNSLYAEMGAEAMEIRTASAWGEGVMNKYGRESFGLNDQHMDELGERLKPLLIERIKTQILG